MHKPFYFIGIAIVQDLVRLTSYDDSYEICNTAKSANLFNF